MVLTAMACMSSSSGIGAARADDTGRFVVARAIINPLLEARQRQYLSNDPRLVGRFVDVLPQRLAFDGMSPCTRVSRTRTRGAVADLLRADLPPGSPARQRPLRLAQHGLGQATSPVGIVQYRCLTPDAGQSGGAPGRAWTGASTFPIGPRQRGLYWQTEAILVLVPAASATPRPSFDCRKARGATETTICRNLSLASWDRSVATAYALLRNGGGPDDFTAAEDQAELAGSQRQFLAERNRCGADRACLEDRMVERVEALMRRQYTTGAT